MRAAGTARHVVVDCRVRRLGVRSAAAGWYIANASASRAPVAGSDRRGIVPCAARSGRPGMNAAHRVAAEGHDDRRIEDLELAPQMDGAQAAISSGSGSRLPGGRHLTTLVMKTSSRRQPMRPEQLDQQVAGRARRTAGPARSSLIARALADEDDLGVGVALARHGRSASRGAGSGADPDLGRDGLERRSALGLGHAVASASSRSGIRAGAPDGGGPDPVALAEDLGDLDGVGRGALAQVVRDDPEGEPAAVRDRHVAPDPPDEDLVAPGGLGRQRVVVLGGIVLDHDARDGREQLAGPIRRDRLARLDVDGLGVADEDRDADRRARDPQVRQVEDLAVLGDDLPLLLGVAVRRGRRRSRAAR